MQPSDFAKRGRLIPLNSTRKRPRSAFHERTPARGVNPAIAFWMIKARRYRAGGNRTRVTHRFLCAVFLIDHSGQKLRSYHRRLFTILLLCHPPRSCSVRLGGRAREPQAWTIGNNVQRETRRAVVNGKETSTTRGNTFRPRLCSAEWRQTEGCRPS